MKHKHNFKALQFEDGCYDPLRAICECGAIQEWNPYTGRPEKIYTGKDAKKKLSDLQNNNRQKKEWIHAEHVIKL